MRKKVTVLLLVLFTVLGITKIVYSMQSVSEEVDATTINISYENLKIKPQKTKEGVQYILTAYHLDHDNLFYTGDFNGKFLLRQYSISNNEIVNEIEIGHVPLDIIYMNDILYVLTLNQLYVCKGHKIHSFDHNIKNIYTYDRLIEINQNLYLLMSNGSSYRLLEEKFIKSENLENIWIQKTSNNTFEVVNKERQIQKIERQEDIGSMQLVSTYSNGTMLCKIDLQNSRNILMELDGEQSKEIFEFNLSNQFYIKNLVKTDAQHIYVLEPKNDSFNIFKL